MRGGCSCQRRRGDEAGGGAERWGRRRDHPSDTPRKATGGSQLHADVAAEDLSVLITSADAHVPPKTITMDVVGTLQKPFSLEDLLAVVEELC